MGDDLQARFVTPYDVGWDFLIKYNHDFIGKEALLEMSKKPQKKCVTLEWNAEDVAEVFATMLRPGEEPCEDITKPCALEYYFCVRELVLSTGRIRCWLQIRRSGSQAEKSSLIPIIA